MTETKELPKTLEQALIQAIIRNPRDQLARNAYSDFLEENDRQEEAEFIRSSDIYIKSIGEASLRWAARLPNKVPNGMFDVFGFLACLKENDPGKKVFDCEACEQILKRLPYVCPVGNYHYVLVGSKF